MVDPVLQADKSSDQVSVDKGEITAAPEPLTSNPPVPARMDGLPPDPKTRGVVELNLPDVAIVEEQALGAAQQLQIGTNLIKGLKIRPVGQRTTGSLQKHVSRP
jgi:hypothetical protein